MKILFLMVVVGLIPNAWSACETAANCRFEFKVGDEFLTYYKSHQNNNSSVERAVIVVHGALRNGDVYFESMVSAAKQAGVFEKTLIIAPHFRRVTDQRKPGELYWGNRWYQKWKYGYSAQSFESISTFELMDELILDIKKNYPNLKKLVITGHSAGGQFVQRYALATVIDQTISVDFVPSNPSSYAYLDSDRFTFTQGNFTLVSPENCEEYNDYIYGLSRRNKYLNRMTREEIRQNYTQKNVIYLMSEEDKKEELLDRSCEANLQGKNRIERAQNYFVYLNRNYPKNKHRFVSIPGVEHDHFGVFHSKKGMRTLFNEDNQTTTPSTMIESWGQWRVKPNANNSSGFLMLGGGKNEVKGIEKFLKKLDGGNLLIITSKDFFLHRYTIDFRRIADAANIPLSGIRIISALNKAGADNKFLIKSIRSADGVFFTGGNQANYISRIKDSSALSELTKRRIPIAGTSAGLAIMGEYIFAARFGGFSSRFALKNPNHPDIDIEHEFFESSLLGNIITDTHFSERNREGRLLTFMNRVRKDYGVMPFGIGVDEQTSVWIDANSFSVSGEGEVFIYRQDHTKSLNMRSVSWTSLKSGDSFASLFDIVLENKLVVQQGRVVKQK